MQSGTDCIELPLFYLGDRNITPSFFTRELGRNHYTLVQACSRHRNLFTRKLGNSPPTYTVERNQFRDSVFVSRNDLATRPSRTAVRRQGILRCWLKGLARDSRVYGDTVKFASNGALETLAGTLLRADISRRYPRKVAGQWQELTPPFLSTPDP